MCRAINTNTGDPKGTITNGETFTKQLRKMLKKMSLDNTKLLHSLEDTENELRYMERDTADELSALKHQIAESSNHDGNLTNRSILSQSPTKLPPSNVTANKKAVAKKPIRKPPPALKEWDSSTTIDEPESPAELFLTKLDHAQQLENGTPKANVAIKSGRKSSMQRENLSEPSWLQEMKQDLNSGTNTDHIAGQKRNGTRPSSRNRVVQGVPMAKLNLVRGSDRK